ncbi:MULTISPECIES: plasmid stabilization protein [Bacillota]|uniref:plasmid stabilization protein n=1 Tax=Bacillota TaxID=1239 RepID=UPI00142901CC|nr:MULTISPECIES: plasmid stabilization protein [Bacillota]EAK0771683.1 plasmid stabilization protein [Campylobacter lari]
MDNDILKALSNLLDEKLKPITQELNNINKKLDGITEQTADLVEFRSEMIKKVDGIREDLATVELVTAKNYKDIVNLKAVK